LSEEVTAGGRWSLSFYDTPRTLTTPAGIDLGPDDLGSLAIRNGARRGTPIFLTPDGRVDVRVNRFWRQPGVRSLTRETQRRYAFSLKVWLDFLQARATPWDKAGTHDLEAFKEWRMSTDEAPVLVTASTFRTDLAALRRFYQWATDVTPGLHNPVRHRVVVHHGQEVERLDLAPSGLRRADVKWLTQDAYRLWRDVGLAGFTATGLPSDGWVGANEDRDLAYADGLFGTGLRRGELASLLAVEVARSGAALQRVWLASSCAKRGHGRPYWQPLQVARRLQFYIDEGSRPAAVARAQATGRYDTLRDRWLLSSEVSSDGAFLVVDPAGATRRVRLDTLPVAVRARLFRPTPAGLEPLWVWLNQDGLPRAKAAWNRTFDAANRRVARVLAARTGPEGALFARPHMLRHSFALRWYTIATAVAWRRMAGLAPQEQRDLRQQMGDVWFLLATLLGHRSADTTREYYLEPFQALEVEHLVALMDADDRAALERLVDQMGAGEPRVLTGTPR
jgi:integrase